MPDFVNAGVAGLTVPVQARILLAGAPLTIGGPAVGTVLPGHWPPPVSLAAASRVVAIHRVTVRPVIAGTVIAHRITG